MTAAPTLRPYQTEALDSLVHALGQGHRRVLQKAPTGTGKTVTFAAMLKWPGIVAWLDQFPKLERRMLVIAHREELLDQAADKIQTANPELLVCVEQADRVASRYADVVVASIQTLSSSKYRRLKRLMGMMTFRIVIVDEAHHAAAQTYRTTLTHLGFLPPADASEGEEMEAATFEEVGEMEKALAGWDAFAPKDRLLVGVTATPNRSDAIGLGCVFQSIAFSYDLKNAIDDKWLVPIVPWVIETRHSLDAVRTTHGDFNQKDLATAVNTVPRNALAVKAWHEHAKGRPTLAFTVDVEHAVSLARVFSDSGARAVALSGQTPRFERHDILRQFMAGDLDVICNCMVLTEGTDLPRASCILHAKPTKSATLYEQMTGRGLRLFKDKDDCIVLDVVDVARKHSLQNAASLYGLPTGLLVSGVALDRAEADLEALRLAHPNVDFDAQLLGGSLTLAQLGAVASTFNIWEVPALGTFGEGRTLNWIKNGERYRLQYPLAEGTESIVVAPDLLGHWDVSATLRPKGSLAVPNPAVRQFTVASQLKTAEDAAAAAEAFVMRERSGVMRLKDKDAPWRLKPASTKQLELLERVNAKAAWKGQPVIPFNRTTLTMGQASDLIDLYNARRGR